MKSWRFNLILIFIILFAAAIISRLVFLQVLNKSYYRALAKGQQSILTEKRGDRGEIFFQNKIPLALNIERKLCYVAPREIKEKEEVAEKLGQILNLDKNFILEKLKKNNLFEIIKHTLKDEEIENLEESKLPGVYLKTEKERYYPHDNLASHLVGFVGGEEKGQYGIEGYWDKILRGKKELIEGEKAPKGYLFFLQKHKTNKGSDIILTVDYNIQYQAEKLLRKAHQDLNIEGGTIIVVEPISGKILALANFPDFNPNNYKKEKNWEVFQNSAIQKIFEPGSMFKAITMSAGLDTGVITPQTSYIDKGTVRIGGYTISNYREKVWGKRTMVEVLEKSINTGAIFVEQQVGHNKFLEYIKRFGIFQPTEVDLQGEIFSQNKEFKKGYEINFATASFGQGIEMTPLQLVRAFCAIANGGKLIRPYAVDKVINPNGEIIKTQTRVSNEKVISQKTASLLTAMLVRVVENGFAKRAQIPGYYVAGKTGTAQIPEKGIYSPNKTWQSFIGYAPAFSPKFLILVKLDNPATKTAEYSAVPIFRELAKYIVDYYQIPPDYEK